MSLEQQGFSIVRDVVGEEFRLELIAESERLMERAGSSCLRHIRAKSDILDRLALSSELLALLPSSLGEMRPVRSILFDKNKKENWPVAWHQDTTVAVKSRRDIPGYQAWSVKDGVTHVRPPASVLEQMWTLRIHLDDTDKTNGCLRVIPESHKIGVIPSDQLRGTIDQGSELACECNAGDVLIMSPLILHASSKAQVIRRRRVLHFEYAPEDTFKNTDGLLWYE